MRHYFVIVPVENEETEAALVARLRMAAQLEREIAVQIHRRHNEDPLEAVLVGFVFPSDVTPEDAEEQAFRWVRSGIGSGIGDLSLLGRMQFSRAAGGVQAVW